MKKTIFTVALLSVVFVSVVLVPAVLAEQATTSGIKRLLPAAVREKLESRKEKVEERKEVAVEKRAALVEKKEDAAERVRKSVVARWNVFNKAVTRAENLLERLQVRIDAAKTAGKDTAAMESAMSDAKDKLADAKSKIASIKDKRETALSRESFREIHDLFKVIKEDLRAAAKDASVIIRNLKSFNSSAIASPSAQKKLSD